MKKYLNIILFFIVTAIIPYLTACNSGSDTPLGAYINKTATTAENILKGSSEGGKELKQLIDSVFYSLRPAYMLHERTGMFSQTNQYYGNILDNIVLFDHALWKEMSERATYSPSDEQETIYYRECLKKNPTHFFHPSQLRAGKVHTITDNAWAYEGMSQGSKIFIVFTQNSELGLAAVVMAPTLDLANQDYKKWQAWWESAGKAEHYQRIEQEKNNKEEQNKRAEYEKQKPEREAAITAVQHKSLSTLEFSDIKYEALEDRGGFALLFKFKVKQSSERPVSSMECDILIKNKEAEIVDVIRIEDRHGVNFEPNKLYKHEIGVKPQSAYRQNLVKKIATGSYTAEIKPVQFYNGERIPLPDYEIEKNLSRNTDGTYSYKGNPVVAMAQAASISEANLQANIQAETSLQESEAKIFEAKQAELAQKYIGEITISFMSLTKSRKDAASILVFAIQNKTGMKLEEVEATFEVLEGEAIVKSGSFSIDIAKQHTNSDTIEKAVYFFDGEPYVPGFQNGTYTMRFEVKKATINGVTYSR